jgi:beta-glucanase (GH16 family)
VNNKLQVSNALLVNNNLIPVSDPTSTWYFPNISDSQALTSNNITVSGGNFNITARKEASIVANQLTGAPTVAAYTSEMVSSLATFTYGTVEATIKTSGYGTHPSLWMLNAASQPWPNAGNDPGSFFEIDIFESGTALGGFTSITDGYYTGGSYVHQTTQGGFSDLSTNFHDYKLVWAPGVLTWYVDGTQIDTYSNANVPSTAMYVLFGAYMGESGFPINDSLLPTTYELAWIRVTDSTGNVVINNNYTNGSYSPTQPTPTFYPTPGTYVGPETVSIISPTASAIYYTTDGSTPTTGSTLYSAPITVAATEIVKALATSSYGPNSAIGTGAYTITHGAKLLAKGNTWRNNTTSTDHPVTLNTTGATLLVAVLTAYGTLPTIQDTSSNPWTYLPAYTAANSSKIRIGYSYGPMTSATDTFQSLANGLDAGYSSAQVYAFSQTLATSSVYDTSTGTTGPLTSPFQTGSVTPTQYDLVIAGFFSGGAISFVTVDSGMESPGDIFGAAGTEWGGASYLLDSGNSPINPTFTTDGVSNTAVIACFKSTG